jgi:CubicO group peptidase (beta-lactamase class C family)
MPNKIHQRVVQAINERVFPGCVVGIVRENGIQEILPFGKFTYDADAPSVQEDTMYDLASVTKSVPVAALALLYISEGRMRLSDPVKKYLPELQNDYGATVEDLLRYRVSGPRLSTLQLRTFEEIRTHILETGFSAPPGDAAYSNIPAFLLGIILERVGSGILPALAYTYFFGPLGMHDTTFFPHDIARIAPTEIVDGVEVRGIVHDESARVFAHARRTVGHAGLFSTAPDLLAFLDVLLYGDFGAVTQGAQIGLGWQVDQPWFMGQHSAKHTFGKTGFTGTSLVCDAKRQIGFVILSNRTYPKRPADASSLTSVVNRFRADIADIILG